LLTFLKVMEVPPDNNFSEQAIRNVKVKLKVSGQFRSEQGADYYAILRSIIDTTIKRKANVLQVLANA
ncbi:MAG: transposase, partial [Saprospiraceae bacterium]